MEHEPKISGAYYPVRNEKIRKSVKEEGRTLLKINIDYPFCEEESKFAVTFNTFYGGLAERFCRYGEKRAASFAKRGTDSLCPDGEIFRSIVSYNTEKAVSVLSDVTHFKSGRSERVRFSAVWDPSDGSLLPYSHFLPAIGVKNRREMRKKVGDALWKMLDTDPDAFGLTEDGVKKYAYTQRPQNCFLTPAGVAFWYDIGTVSKADDLYPTVVLPYASY